MTEVFIASNLFRRLRSYSLMLFRRYKSNIISILQQSLDKWLKVLHSCLKQSSYVASFNFSTGTLRAYPMKSIVIIVILSFRETSAVGTTSSAFLMSFANSDLWISSSIHSSLGRMQCLLIHILIAQQYYSLAVWHSRCSERFLF